MKNKDLKVIGGIMLTLALLFTFFFMIGHEYGNREENHRTKRLVEEIMSLEEELGTYKIYYNCAETLLDTLNQHYDWVDAYDPTEYYDIVSVINKCAE